MLKLRNQTMLSVRSFIVMLLILLNVLTIYFLQVYSNSFAQRFPVEYLASLTFECTTELLINCNQDAPYDLLSTEIYYSTSNNKRSLLKAIRRKSLIINFNKYFVFGSLLFYIFLASLLFQMTDFCKYSAYFSTILLDDLLILLFIINSVPSRLVSLYKNSFIVIVQAKSHEHCQISLKEILNKKSIGANAQYREKNKKQVVILNPFEYHIKDIKSRLLLDCALGEVVNTTC